MRAPPRARVAIEACACHPPAIGYPPVGRAFGRSSASGPRPRLL